MKAQITAILTLDDRVFGPASEDRTRLDILQHLSQMVKEGKGIESVFVKEFKILEKEDEKDIL